MSQKIYITTKGKEKSWRERPDGQFSSTKSKFILSHTDVQKSLMAGHLKVVPNGDAILTMPMRSKPINKSTSYSDQINQLF